MGGKFQDGAIGGATTAAFSLSNLSEKLRMGEEGDWRDLTKVAERTALAGVLGGTASAIGGGKFGNGCFTAAFQHLLNGEIPDEIQSALLNKDTPWLSVANDQLGKTTKNGASEYWLAMGKSGAVVSWCAAFTCWVLNSVGISSPNSVAARSYDGWGSQSATPSLGSVATIHWPKEGTDKIAWKGHSTFVVATFIEKGKTWIVGLGGNQDGMVKYKTYPIENKGYEKPITFAHPLKYTKVDPPMLKEWHGDRLTIGTER